MYFICDVIFEKLLKLQQISCVIHHLVEIQDSLYRAKFSINHYENWCKWRVFVSKHALKLQNVMRSLSQNIAVLTHVVTSSTQNWLENVPKLVSHVLMVIRTLDEVFVCETIFSTFWNSSPMLWHYHRKIESKRAKFVYHVELTAKILKTETIITLTQKFFLPEEFLSKDFKTCETCTKKGANSQTNFQEKSCNG